MIRAVPALAAGAALLVAGCGGILGTPMSPTLQAIVPIKCAIAKTVAEDGNYSTAVFYITGGLSFAGNPADNLARPANRLRVFRQRANELRRQESALRALAPADATDRRYARAARADLHDARALAKHDLKWAPGDPKAPDSTHLNSPDGARRPDRDRLGRPQDALRRLHLPRGSGAARQGVPGLRAGAFPRVMGT